MEQFKPKLNLLLKYGVSIYILSFVIISIFQLPVTWAVNKEFISLPSLYFFFAVTIVGPLWEEFVFRFSLSKQWWLNRIIMLFYAALCFWVTKSILLTSVIVLFTIIYNVMINRKDARTLMAFAFFSTLSWAFIHYSSDAPNAFGQIMNVTAILGLGLILSFIRLRYSFLAVLVTHITWNCMAVLISHFYAQSTYQIKHEALEISLRKNNWLETTDIGSSLVKQGEVTFIKNATLSEIIPLALERLPNKNYRIKPVYAKYSGQVQFGTLSPIVIADAFNLALDSSEALVSGYLLEVNPIDSSYILASNHIEYKAGFEIIRNSIPSILTKIANDYDVPVRITGMPETLRSLVTVQYPSNAKSIDEVVSYLNISLGGAISLQPAQLTLKTYYFY